MCYCSFCVTLEIFGAIQALTMKHYCTSDLIMVFLDIAAKILDPVTNDALHEVKCIFSRLCIAIINFGPACMNNNYLTWFQNE